MTTLECESLIVSFPSSGPSFPSHHPPGQEDGFLLLLLYHVLFPPTYRVRSFLAQCLSKIGKPLWCGLPSLAPSMLNGSQREVGKKKIFFTLTVSHCKILASTSEAACYFFHSYLPPFPKDGKMGAFSSLKGRSWLGKAREKNMWIFQSSAAVTLTLCIVRAQVE